MADPLNPLGQNSEYPVQFDPDLLFPIARRDARENFGCADEQPFDGEDVWTAWELTWLLPGGRPAVAVAEIRVPSSTPNLIESKSLKLYLSSFAMTVAENSAEVAATITRDLSAAAGGDVSVLLQNADTNSEAATLPGQSIDALTASFDATDVDARLLRADGAAHVEQHLHTHLLRSLCPVTGQPDIGSLWVHAIGPKIDPASLLQYVVSFRQHNDFHEACIERMFVDILKYCRADRLSLYARYQRRGGIDINPFRSNFEACPGNLRLWRQ
ncbi:MAG: NADPH-dependent 7-cyano-7-deazaguanine reductase QueF [Gammaproteobacteria bacterium]|nr:NADPH-dependent 7-cyano-7-deazaguanine reductase QueF [Gammaproteobacteria bacterium]